MSSKVVRGFAVLVAGLSAVGLAACGSGSDKSKSQAATELAQAHAQIRAERATAQDELESIGQRVEGKRVALSTLRSQVRRTRRKLDRLQSQLGGARSEVAKSTIPGTGTYEVGKDINAGTYRADASPGCYWARLASLETSDIVDNDNADGPVAVTIQPSDAAFETDGCADFHKSS